MITDDEEDALEECECGSGEMTDVGGCCSYCFDDEGEDDND